MKHFIFVLFLFSLLSFGNDRLPQLSKDAAKQTEFLNQVIKENPWLVGAVTQSMQALAGKEQAFLPELIKHPQYIKLLERQRPPITIHVEKGVMVEEKTFALSPVELKKIRKETKEILGALNGKNDLFEALDLEIREKLKVLATADPKGIMVGMIQCLEKGERGALFKIGDREVLLEKLGQSDLNDETLKREFRGAPHGIPQDEVSKQFLVEHVRQLLEKGKELIPLLRARWFLGNQHPDVLGELTRAEIGPLIENAEVGDFDTTEADGEKVETFFEELIEPLKKGSKESTKRAKEYLLRVQETWEEAEKVETKRMVGKGEPHFIIREVPPYIAVHRSALTHDCGTRDDFALPYSPLERTFFVEVGERAMGYVGTTLLETNGEPTLFVHDLTGAISAQVKGQVLHALFAELPRFGAKRITLGTMYVDIALGFRGQAVHNTFLDIEVRGFLAKHCANPHGDRPQDNPGSALFVPQEDFLKGHIIRVNEEKPVEQRKPKTPKEALKSLFDLVGANDGTKVDVAYLGFSDEQRTRILKILQNPDREPLAVYYENLEILLKEYGLELSQKFMKRYAEALKIGHLGAADVLENQDHLDRTMEYIITNLKRGDRKRVLEVIKENPAFFEKSNEFVEYVSTIPLVEAEHLARINELVGAGLKSETIAPTKERLLALTDAKEMNLQMWAIREWRKREGKLPPALIHHLAKLLDNEEHPSEEPSLSAIKVLMRTKISDQKVIDTLALSVEEEENLEIKYRAAVALLKNGFTSDEVEAVIKENKANKDLSEGLRGIGKKHAARAKKCANVFRRLAPIEDDN